MKKKVAKSKSKKKRQQEGVKAVAVQNDSASLQLDRLPDHETSRPLRQNRMLQMQQQHGNSHVQQVLRKEAQNHKNEKKPNISRQDDSDLTPTIPPDLMVNPDLTAMTPEEVRKRYFRVANLLNKFKMDTEEKVILEDQLQDMIDSGMMSQTKEAAADIGLASNYRNTFFSNALALAGLEARIRHNRLDKFKEVSELEDIPSLGESILLEIFKTALNLLPGGGVAQSLQKFGAFAKNVEELTDLQKNWISFGVAAAQSGYKLAKKGDNEANKLRSFAIAQYDTILHIDVAMTANLTAMNELSRIALEVAVDGMTPYYLVGRVREWVENELGPVPVGSESELNQYAKEIEFNIWKEWARQNCQIVTLTKKYSGYADQVFVYVDGWKKPQVNYFKNEFGISPTDVAVAKSWGLKEVSKKEVVPRGTGKWY